MKRGNVEGARADCEDIPWTERNPFVVARILTYLVLALATAGIATLGSASTVRAETVTGDPLFFLKRQLIWLGVGLIVAFIVAHVDYRRWRPLAQPLAVLSVLLLIAVLIFGRRINGCLRWLQVGPVNFQPSELAKLAVILMLAYWYAERPLRIGRLKEGLVYPSLGLGGVLGLVLMEPDFGTTALIGAVGWIMLYLGGANKRLLYWGAAVGILLLALYVCCDPHRRELVLAWLFPEKYPQLAFHYLEAKKAYLLGGATGVGYLGGMEKHYYLPEVHTDFILPIVAEELGLIGTLGVVALFAGFFACGMIISLRVPDFFGRLLGFGLTILIILQAVFNMCVVTGLLPTKGLALPFFSYGGSNLLMTLVESGLLISVCRHAFRDNS